MTLSDSIILHIFGNFFILKRIPATFQPQGLSDGIYGDRPEVREGKGLRPLELLLSLLLGVPSMQCLPVQSAPLGNSQILLL